MANSKRSAKYAGRLRTILTVRKANINCTKFVFNHINIKENEPISRRQNKMSSDTWDLRVSSIGSPEILAYSWKITEVRRRL
jgi:hypothetical protein